MIGQLVQVIRIAIVWILSQKWRILAAVALVPLFVLLLFPLKDLSDFVTNRVAKETGNQVYVQFDEMSLSLIPDLGLSLDKFSVEIGGMSPITADRVGISPSPMMLATQKVQGSLSANGIFGGEATLSVKPGRKTESGALMQQVAVEAEKIRLQDLKQLLNLPIGLRGAADIKAEGSVDPAFLVQPDVSFDVKANKLEMESSSINSPMGPIVLPALNLSRITMKGRLSDAKLLLEEVLLGAEGDEFVGKVSGQIGFELRNIGGNFIPIAGAYNYKVDLWASKDFNDRARFFLQFFDKYQTPDGKGFRFRFGLTGDARNGSFTPNALQ